MEDIIKLLKNIHFSEQEAKIYLQCLKTPGVTVFQVSKVLHISRTSVYATMEKMSQKGILLVEHGAKELYYSEKPDILLSKLNQTYDKQINQLKNVLKDVHTEIEQEPYLNIHGFKQIIGKARTMIYGSKSEIYINTDLDLNVLGDALRFLEPKGVDIYAFSFQEQNYKHIGMKLYSHHLDRFEPSRLMLVIDNHEVLVANKHEKTNTWHATYTRNPLMVSIISEHIHHDIYLLLVEQKYNKDFLKIYPNIEIGSKLEKKFEKKTNIFPIEKDK
jgi:predicted DNA-binding transcriptional regulator